MKKIVIVLGSFANRDGIGNSTIYLYNSLVDAGYDCTVITGYVDASVPIPAYNTIQLEEFVDDNTVILYTHSHTIESLDKVMALPNRKICLYHNITPLDAFSSLSEKSKQNIHHDIRMLIRNYNIYSDVVATSLETKKSFEHFAQKFPKERIHIFPPYTSQKIIDLGDQSGTKENTFVIVGRLSNHKRVELGIKLFARIRSLVTDAKLHIIGKIGEQEYFNEILALVDDLELGNSFEWLEDITDEELRNEYRSAYGHINASAHEGYSMPTMESMYYGCAQFVQGGHASEELLALENLKPFDFNKLDDYSDDELLDFLDNKPSDLLDLKNKFVNASNVQHIIDIIERPE